MLRTCSAVIVGTAVLGTVTPEETITAKLIEYGVLGILVILLILREKQRQDKADERWDATNKQLFAYLEKNTSIHTETGNAVRQLTDELRNRPCIQNKDQHRR